MWGKGKNSEPVGALIADLDEIVQGKSRIKLHGKFHQVNPILVEEFFALSGAFAKIRAIEEAEKPSLEDLIDGYYSIIFPTIPTIAKDDLRECSHSQLAALLQTVLNHITGGLTPEKKKEILTMALPERLRA